MRAAVCCQVNGTLCILRTCGASCDCTQRQTCRASEKGSSRNSCIGMFVAMAVVIFHEFVLFGTEKMCGIDRLWLNLSDQFLHQAFRFRRHLQCDRRTASAPRP